MTIAIWTGDPLGICPHLPDTFLTAAMTPQTEKASLLINLAEDEETAIEGAMRFASWDPVEGEDRLVVNVLRAHTAPDWPKTRAAAALWAFTRHAALHWAPRGIRVNALGLGLSPVLPGHGQEDAARAAGAAPQALATPAEIAACIMAMWRWRSMTGQLIRLGA